MDYTIVRGDTLDAIAKRFGTTYQELARVNHIPNPNLIITGDHIQVPPYDQPAVPASSSEDESDDGMSTGSKIAIIGVVGITAVAVDTVLFKRKKKSRKRRR